jgi:hypothetical protein
MQMPAESKLTAENMTRWLEGDWTGGLIVLNGQYYYADHHDGHGWVCLPLERDDDPGYATGRMMENSFVMRALDKLGDHSRGRVLVGMAELVWDAQQAPSR